MTAPAWLGWVVAGVVVAGLIASCSDDGATDTSADSKSVVEPDVEIDDGVSVDVIAEEERARPPRTYRVRSVTDGDTLRLANGDSVRLVGIDAPENGACGSVKATELLARLTLGKRVTLVAPITDRDRYDRLLRYVEVGGADAGRELIASGLAIARYDSRDGYEHHPRQARYVRLDRATPNMSCVPVPLVNLPPAQESGCAPGYSPCIPAYPPDLDCADTGPVSVSGSDPHGLDADGDGVACGGD